MGVLMKLEVYDSVTRDHLWDFVGFYAMPIMNTKIIFRTVGGVETEYEIKEVELHAQEVENKDIEDEVVSIEYRTTTKLFVEAE